MANDRRRAVREAFMRAADVPEPERSELLDRICSDPELRREVEVLLQADRSAIAGRFMTEPTAQGETPSHFTPIFEHPGTRIGPYKLLQQIGEGGFGVVFMAEQDRPVKRRVALKIIKLGMDTRQVVARFEQERQALALMDHPNVAKVLDAGTTESGRPYFVMEYVKGDPITSFADAHRLTLAERLSLFTQVCHAVQHAHTKGIIHRDLKPSNVLVSMTDGKPLARVIDFGIAKATGTPLTDKTLFTEHRQLIGTPEYMSPEQAEGLPDIDTRSDIYALGVLLYELLTGVTPFDAKRLRSAAWAEMQRIIKEEEPPVPSVRISRELNTLATTAAARHIEPGRLGTLVRGELDWIVMKALDKDRARRYETPSQLADDVRRHLSGDAVMAAPTSAVYRLRKFVRRNRGPVAAGGAIAAVLVMGVLGTTWQWWRAESVNIQLRSEVRRARLAEASTMFEVVDRSQGDSSLPDNAQAIAEGVIATREALLGPSHLDTVKALWLAGELTGDESRALQIYEEAAQRLERTGSHPDSALTERYISWALRPAIRVADLDTSLRWLSRIARAVPSIYSNEGLSAVRSISSHLASDVQIDFGVPLSGQHIQTTDDVASLASRLSAITASQLLEGAWWRYLHYGRLDTQETQVVERVAQLARQALAVSPEDPFALTALAVAQRVVETPEAALQTVERAMAARSSAGIPPSAANACVAALSFFAVGRVDEAREEMAQLRKLRETYPGQEGAWNRNLEKYFAEAEIVIDPPPTAEGLLAEESRKRRLAEADLQFRDYSSNDPDIHMDAEPLERVIETRQDLLGPSHIETIQARWVLGTLLYRQGDVLRGLDAMHAALAQHQTASHEVSEFLVAMYDNLAMAELLEGNLDEVEALYADLAEVLSLPSSGSLLGPEGFDRGGPLQIDYIYAAQADGTGSASGGKPYRWYSIEEDVEYRIEVGEVRARLQELNGMALRHAVAKSITELSLGLLLDHAIDLCADIDMNGHKGSRA